MLCFCLNFFFNASSVTFGSEYEIESTLEVLQGAKLFPSNSMMCGPACLYIAAKYLNIGSYSLNDIVKMTDWNYVDGTSMLGLENACKKMGLNTRAFKLNADQLGRLMNQNNALAVVESQDHFFLFVKSEGGAFLKITTPIKPEWIQLKEITDTWDWDGKALLFSKSPIKAKVGFSKLPLLGGFVGFTLIGIVVIGYLLKKSVFKANN